MSLEEEIQRDLASLHAQQVVLRTALMRIAELEHGRDCPTYLAVSPMAICDCHVGIAQAAIEEMVALCEARLAQAPQVVLEPK